MSIANNGSVSDGLVLLVRRRRSVSSPRRVFMRVAVGPRVSSGAIPADPAGRLTGGMRVATVRVEEGRGGARVAL